MMETVDVRVTIFWCGDTKQISVPVEVQSFEPGKRCARSIAAIKAAALMGVPFTDVLRIGSFEMLKEDKARLRELFGGDDGAHCAPLQEAKDGNGARV